MGKKREETQKNKYQKRKGEYHYIPYRDLKGNKRIIQAIYAINLRTYMKWRNSSKSWQRLN